MSAYVELDQYVTLKLVEMAHARALQKMKEHDDNFAETGMRAARAGDVRLLKTLEFAAERINAEEDLQLGQTKRSVNATHSESKGTTEAQLWRETYRLLDESMHGAVADRDAKMTALGHFRWILGAAAWICGYNN